MKLSEFEFKINRSDLHRRSTNLKAIVTAISNLTQARDQAALDVVKRAYKRWKDSGSVEYNKRGAPIEAEMKAAFLHAPGQYLRELITVIDPESHPIWEPEKWGGNILNSTNCYAYACNDRYGHARDTKQDPGGYYEKHKTRDDTYRVVEPNPIDPNINRAVHEAAVRSGVQADNYIRSRFGESVLTECIGAVENKPGHYLIALVVSGADYHWYRQDSTGYWSGKRGFDMPSEKHNLEVIKDPREINDVLSTPPRFFYVPKNGARTYSSNGTFLFETRSKVRFAVRTPSFTGLGGLYNQGDDADFSLDNPLVSIDPIQHLI